MGLSFFDNEIDFQMDQRIRIMRHPHYSEKEKQVLLYLYSGHDPCLSKMSKGFKVKPKDIKRIVREALEGGMLMGSDYELYDRKLYQ